MQEFYSPYLYVRNNPLILIDPDGMGSDETDFNIIDWFMGWVNDIFSQSTPQSQLETQELEDMAEKGDKAAQIALEKKASVNNIPTPYVSLSVGKQAWEPIGQYGAGGFGSLMVTPDGLYGTYGRDLSLSPSGFSTVGTPYSLSLSAGLIWGPKSNIEGWGYGFGGGALAGFEYSRATSSFPWFNNNTNTFSTGFVFSNTLIWVTGNISYTKQLISF